MDRWTNKLDTINRELNGLPHKLLIIFIMLFAMFLAIAAFPYVAPFVLAALFAWMIDRPVGLLTRLLERIHLKRNVAAALCTLVVFGIVMFLVVLLFARIFEEIKSLAIVLPGWAARTASNLLAWAEGLEIKWDVINDTVRNSLNEMLTALGRSITGSASQLASFLARSVWNTATVTMPEIILFTILTVMGTFYISSDPKRIYRFLHSLIPERIAYRSMLLKNSLFQAVFSQIRAQLMMLCITFVELLIGFSIIRMEYSALLALLISILDALPVIGTGLFLFPFMLYGVVIGDYRFAIGMALLYIIVGVVRQFIEPRIIGKQLGLNPLATMMSMYAGYRLMSFVGMLLGPMVLLLCKVALTATDALEKSEKPAPVPQKTHFKRRLK